MTFSKFRLLFIFQLLLSAQAFSQYNFKAYLEEAKTDVNNKNYTEAIQKLNVCIQVKPNECEAFFYRGICKYFLNDFQGSKQDLDNAVTHYTQIYYDAWHFRALSQDRLEDFQ